MAPAIGRSPARFGCLVAPQTDEDFGSASDESVDGYEAGVPSLARNIPSSSSDRRSHVEDEPSWGNKPRTRHRLNQQSTCDCEAIGVSKVPDRVARQMCASTSRTTSSWSTTSTSAKATSSRAGGAASLRSERSRKNTNSERKQNCASRESSCIDSTARHFLSSTTPDRPPTPKVGTASSTTNSFRGRRKTSPADWIRDGNRREDGAKLDLDLLSSPLSALAHACRTLSGWARKNIVKTSLAPPSIWSPARSASMSRSSSIPCAIEQTSRGTVSSSRGKRPTRQLRQRRTNLRVRTSATTHLLSSRARKPRRPSGLCFQRGLLKLRISAPMMCLRALCNRAVRLLLASLVYLTALSSVFLKVQELLLSRLFFDDALHLQKTFSHVGPSSQMVPLLGAFAWHYIPGSNESNIFYTFQEFYTDAQYGPDFGYYSKGRILQGEFFNSYTTFPMGLSPMFGNLIADRLHATWLSMDQPKKFDIFEFGGGTGVLARDILLRITDKYPEMAPKTRYTLGERAAGLRRQQKKTIAAANITDSDRMFRVAEADAREAARLKKPGKKFVGAVISNELLDEFDPVKLRLVWPTGDPPNPSKIRSCRTWREVYVMHRVDKSLLLNSNWQREASAIVCAYLDDPWIARLIAKKFSHERRCYPYAVCCVPLLLALNKILHYDHQFLERLEYRNFDFLLQEYEKEVADARVLVTKEQYRMIRRAHLHDYHLEEALLTGDKIATDQVAMLLTEERCSELTSFFARHAQRFARAAERRDAIERTSPLNELASSSFLKWVVRPGEEAFAKEASKLLDKGIMIAIDYGADFEALAWLQIVKPNYEGIHIMDARFGNFCTNKGELQCPGMHDITTNVDFTNFADRERPDESARDFQVVSYAPMIELERSFGFGAREESLFPHVIEQAGGIRSAGVWGWYSTKNTEPWASFKLLIMQKGEEGFLKKNPFHGMAQFPLLKARDEIANCMEDMMLPSLAGAILRESKLKLNSVEPWATAHILSRMNPDLIYDQELERQRAVMNEYHLSILLLDYATHLSAGQCPIQWDEDAIKEIAEARLLNKAFGDQALERALRYYVQVNNMTVVKPSYVAQFTPVGCMLRKGLLSYCGHAEVLDEAYAKEFVGREGLFEAEMMGPGALL